MFVSGVELGFCQAISVSWGAKLWSSSVLLHRGKCFNHLATTTLCTMDFDKPISAASVRTELPAA
jgi:hypothetical protein